MIQGDDYGVRDVLIDCARDYLTGPIMRLMVARLQELAAEESDEFRKRQWLHNVESLARQLKDAPLFEAARLASWGRLSTAACVDIARVYLECGHEPTALTWLEKIPAADTFMVAERDGLLLEIYGRFGDLAKRNQGRVAHLPSQSQRRDPCASAGGDRPRQEGRGARGRGRGHS